MQEKQSLQDPGYVDTVDTCCMLHAKTRSHPNTSFLCMSTLSIQSKNEDYKNIRIRTEFELIKLRGITALNFQLRIKITIFKHEMIGSCFELSDSN